MPRPRLKRTIEEVKRKYYDVSPEAKKKKKKNARAHRHTHTHHATGPQRLATHTLHHMSAAHGMKAFALSTRKQTFIIYLKFITQSQCVRFLKFLSPNISYLLPR